MKKYLAISLAFLYLLVSSGLLLEVHHCMGKIADAALTILPSDEDQCGKCGMDKDDKENHCCKDEYKLVKVTSDQKPSAGQVLVNAPAAIELSLVWPATYVPEMVEEVLVANRAHAPPFPGDPSYSQLYCVFRI